MAASVSSLTAPSWKSYVRPALLDVFALAFIYFLPAISHMLSIKFYLIEPMRVMLVLALVHTHKKNAYLLALSLPLFSFLVSAHPVLVKTMLISAELVVNVALFYFLVKRMHVLAAIFLSIWLSKIFYYGLKYLAMLSILPGDSLVSTPLMIQLATSVVFSLYLFAFFKKEKV